MAKTPSGHPIDSPRKAVVLFYKHLFSQWDECFPVVVFIMILWLTLGSYCLSMVWLNLKFVNIFFYRIETSSKLSSWRSGREPTGKSEAKSGNKSLLSSNFGRQSSNLAKTSFDFEKTSSGFRNTALDFEKSSDSEDWASSRGRVVGKADSSYGSWTGGSPARDSSTSPKSSFSSSSNSLGARVGLSTLK